MSVSRAEKSNGSSLAASFESLDLDAACFSSLAALPPFFCRHDVVEKDRKLFAKVVD